MPTILLIRHAENEYVAKGRLAGRLPDVHLNSNGKKQAEAIANALGEAPIKAIYASPLERCLETAQPLADRLGVTVMPREGLLEIDFGDWQDKTLKQLHRRKLWKIVQGNPARMHFPGGESFATAQTRIRDELELLSKTHNDKDLIACFSHSDLIRLAVAYYIGTPLDLFQRITISPASISTLYIGDSGTRIIHVNHGVSLGFPNHTPHQKDMAAKKEVKDQSH
jgi:probable phosphomutase (TIGR03848 family)